MRETQLPSPGTMRGLQLRREACKEISAIEIIAGRTNGGKVQQAKQLSDFFAACVTALATKFESVLPTITTRVATSAVLATVTFSEAMDQTVLPALAAWTSAGNTITASQWTSSTTLTLTGTGFAAADNLTYTQPATSGLRDLAGNLLATTSAALT